MSLRPLPVESWRCIPRNGTNSGAVLSNFVDAVSDTDEKLLEHLDQLVKAKRRVLRRPE